MENLSRVSFAGMSAGHDQPAASTAIVPAAKGGGARVLHRGPYIMMALALIGMAVAVYDSYAIYNGQLLWCPPPINGCNEVAASPYARIFDLPVGYYGVVYYLCMFGLSALLAFDPLARGLRVGAVLYTALGVLFSLYFMVLQLGFISAFCIYCLVSAVTTVLLAVAMIRDGRMPTPEEANEALLQRRRAPFDGLIGMAEDLVRRAFDIPSGRVLIRNSDKQRR